MSSNELWICKCCQLQNHINKTKCQACYAEKTNEIDTKATEIERRGNKNQSWEVVGTLCNPSVSLNYARPILIKDEIFILSEINSDMPRTLAWDFFSHDNWHLKKLIKYNVTQNKYTVEYVHDKFINIPKYFECIAHSIVYYNKNNMLYIHTGNKGKTYSLNCSTYELKIVSKLNVKTEYAQLFVIDGKLHLIGGTTNNKHFIYDIVNDTIATYTLPFSVYSDISGFGMVYITSQKKLLVLGGYRITDTFDVIYSYSISDNKWDMIKALLPKKMCNFGCILTSNEKHVVMFGGLTNDIYIMNLEGINTGNVYCENIEMKCPQSSPFSALLIDNVKESKLAIYGYVRIYLDARLPDDIVGTCCKFYSQQYVHLFYSNMHWRIGMNQIMNSKVNVEE